MADEAPDTAQDPDDRATLRDDANALIGIEGLWSGRILHTAATLGLFEHLDSDPKTAHALADELDLDANHTYRLLRAMAHYGVLDETQPQGFALTPLGELFQADHPETLQPDLLFNRSPEWARTMLHLPDIVTEGGPNGFVREFGRGFYEYLETHPEFEATCNAVMESASRDHPDHVLEFLDSYDVSELAHVCDVGGGHGRLLCHVLDAYPHLQGTVLERPSVIAEEEQRWAPQLDVTDRCTYVPGDMFEAVPAADAYFLKWILHNWTDEECRDILSTIHEAAPADGRLFVIETVVPGPGTSHFAKRLDITMMVQVSGRERTKAEYSDLLAQSGWELVETWTPEAGAMSVLEARLA